MTKSHQDQVYFRPRNWERFQHYKDRQPAWIKLHAGLLRDFDFCQLTHQQQVVLLKLWLLYSQVSHALPMSATWLGRQIDEHSNVLGKALPVLKYNGFIELCDKNASIVLAERKHSASLETETETETDSMSHSPPSGSNGKSSDDPFFLRFWEAFPRQRRGSKSKAQTAWRNAIKRATPDEILTGLNSYASSDEVARGFGKGAAAWLNDDRWASQYKPAATKKDGAVGNPRGVYMV